jgi:hypothetical protein
MRRIFSLAAVSLFMMAMSAGAQSPYVVTGSDGAFTVSRNNNAMVTGVPMDTAITAIRKNALGEPVTVQFGNGDAALNAGAATVRFQVMETDSLLLPEWGKVTLTGKLTTNNTLATSAVILNNVTVESSADITVTGNNYRSSFYVNGKSSLTIAGGTISSTGYAVAAGSADVKITVTGGELSSTSPSYPTISGSAASIKITGGTISAETGIPLSMGAEIEISGGKIQAADNHAINCNTGNLSISISGDAVITSSASAGKATINSAAGTGEIKIAGGEVSNTADGGRAVSLTGASRKLKLDGAPKITGSIYTRFKEIISVEASFAPGNNTYTLELLGNARSNGAVAVTGGAAHIGKFSFDGNPYSLKAENGNIIVTLPADFTAPLYVITGDSIAGFTVKKGDVTVGTATGTNAMRDIIDSIRADAQVKPCSIRFGSGNQTLSPGRSLSNLTFNGASGNGWGRITLLGRYVSNVEGNQGNQNPAVIVCENGVSVESAADIKHQRPDYRAIRVLSDADLTIKGGTVSGPVEVNSGTLTIDDGTVSSQESYWCAIENSAGGTVQIKGGTVKSTYPGLSAINNVGGEIAISGTAIITSADTSRDGGTILNRLSGSISISGGKIENTAESGGYALFNNGDSASSVTISGGEITSQNGKVLNSGGGTLKSVKGTVEITGGKILNTYSGSLNGGFAIVNLGSSANNVYAKDAIMYISGTAEITAVTTNTSSASIYNSSGGFMTISGGKISNTADNGNSIAVMNRSATLNISGTAEIVSASDIAGTVYNAGAGYEDSTASRLQITGGTITSTADSNGVAVYSYLGRGGGSTLIIGGSPAINGEIFAAGDGSIAPSIITTGESAFAPGSTVYNIHRSQTPPDGDTVLTNGARFAQNFTFVDARRNPYTNLKFVASGNNLIATTGEILTVTFDLNGGVGTPPPPIRIVANGRLGAAAMPPTAGYLDAGNHLNDGKWYRKINMQGDLNPTPFNFDAVDGTRVTEDIVLALNWTNEVSVLANDRVIPSKPGAEIVIVAPVTVTAGELTVGPNPVAKQSGAVTFFWNGKGLAGGKLFIYDASGSLVRKINIADKPTANKGKRSVGSWNLADAKGRPVSEGTYLVKGAVSTADGAKVKASALIGVVR